MATMIPLADATRRPSRFPTVTSAIIVMNCIAFLLELAGGGAFVGQWSVIPADVAAGRHLFTIISAMFLHAGWLHIIGNMVYLWAFGPEIEDTMGSIPYLAFYLISGIVAFVAQIAADPHSTIPNLGASGAIAGVMGAFLVTYPADRIKTLILLGWFLRITFVPAVLLIGFWFVIQFVSQFLSISDVRTEGVAYVAHVCGFIFGAVTARTFERFAGRSRWST